MDASTSGCASLMASSARAAAACSDCCAGLRRSVGGAVAVLRPTWRGASGAGRLSAPVPVSSGEPGLPGLPRPPPGEAGGEPLLASAASVEAGLACEGCGMAGGG